MATDHIPDMSCGHCKAMTAPTIQALDPAARIDFDMAALSLSVASTLGAVQIQPAPGQAVYPSASP